MFDNIGGKIKTLASVICVVGMIGFIILGLLMTNESGLLGVLIIVLGVIGSWTGSFCLYGFGELIEDTHRNRQIGELLLKAYNGPGNASDGATRAASVGSYTIPKMKNDSSGDSWRCSNCNAINHRTQQYCAACGKYK